MSPSKRPIELVEIFDEPDPQPLTAPPFKSRRLNTTTGTRDQPIDLASSDDNDLALNHSPVLYPSGLGAVCNTLINPSDDQAQRAPTPQPPGHLDQNDCIRSVLEIYPDIAHDHVATLWFQCDGTLERVLESIIEATDYPKERARKAKEIVQKESCVDAEEKTYADQLRPRAIDRVRGAIFDILRNEFPKISLGFVAVTLSRKSHLYTSYLALDEAQNSEKPPYGPVRHRAVRKTNLIAIAAKWLVEAAPLGKELLAARQICDSHRTKREAKAAHEAKEKSNEETCRLLGQMAECATCYDELPQNRMICCNAGVPHFTCYDCISTYIKSEIGQSRCRISCPDTSRCAGAFTESQLHLVPDQSLVDKLLRLQQEQDMREAGIDDLVHCPFCDYKAVCLPIDTDFEFRCQQLGCEIVSCRKCDAHSHIPYSCEEAAQRKNKDRALEHRHKVAEAMTAALVRSCNGCKKPFVKELGCNKMTCPSCGNTQCYVCGENCAGYIHFSKSKCPLTDDVEERHKTEVKKAEAAARGRIQAENPDIATQYLDFEFSDRVKHDEQTALHRGRGLPPGAPGLGRIPLANIPVRRIPPFPVIPLQVRANPLQLPVNPLQLPANPLQLHAPQVAAPEVPAPARHPAIQDWIAELARRRERAREFEARIGALHRHRRTLLDLEERRPGYVEEPYAIRAQLNATNEAVRPLNAEPEGGITKRPNNGGDPAVAARDDAHAIHSTVFQQLAVSRDKILAMQKELDAKTGRLAVPNYRINVGANPDVPARDNVHPVQNRRTAQPLTAIDEVNAMREYVKTMTNKLGPMRGDINAMRVAEQTHRRHNVGANAVRPAHDKFRAGQFEASILPRQDQLLEPTCRAACPGKPNGLDINPLRFGHNVFGHGTLFENQFVGALDPGMARLNIHVDEFDEMLRNSRDVQNKLNRRHMRQDLDHF